MKRGGGGRGIGGQSSLKRFFQPSKEKNDNMLRPPVAVTPGPSSTASSSKKRTEAAKNPDFEEQQFKEGEAVRRNVRPHLDELVRNGSIRDLENGRDDRPLFVTPSYPQFTTRLQFGMINSTETTTGLEVYHCAFPACMTAPLQCKTRCADHLHSNMNEFIISEQIDNAGDRDSEFNSDSDDPASHVEAIIQEPLFEEPSDIEMTTGETVLGTCGSKKRKLSPSPNEKMSVEVNKGASTSSSITSNEQSASFMDLSWFQPESDDLFPDICTQPM